MNLIIGLIVVVLSVLGGFSMAGGELNTLFVPAEFIIILGTAIGALIIANSPNILRDTARAISQVFQGAKFRRGEYLQLLGLMYSVIKVAKTKGLMHLERDIEHPDESDLFAKYPSVLQHRRSLEFLCDYMRLVSLGSEKPNELETLMDEEIETIESESKLPARALQTLGEALPALGIIAAVLGVIKALVAFANGAPPAELAGFVANALVGTFLGVALAYTLVTPLATIVRSHREVEMAYFHCLKSGLIAYLHGYAPQICVEYARKVLPTDVQPSFYEVEAATSLSSAQRAGSGEAYEPSGETQTA